MKLKKLYKQLKKVYKLYGNAKVVDDNGKEIINIFFDPEWVETYISSCTMEEHEAIEKERYEQWMKNNP